MNEYFIDAVLMPEVSWWNMLILNCQDTILKEH